MQLKFSKPKVIWQGPAILGEGPFINQDNSILFWVDIKGQKFHSCHLDNKSIRSWLFPQMVGAVFEDGSDCFIAGTQSGFCKFTLPVQNTQISMQLISDPESNKPGNRFNDGKRAPDGSIWAGTMDNTETDISGTWWRLACDGNTKRLDPDHYKVTNGPVFDEKNALVYLTDSAVKTIYVCDLIGNGLGMKNKRIFAKFGVNDGYPDGMCLDPYGFLIVAFWDGACLCRLDNKGNVMQKIAMPVSRPTSIVVDEIRQKLYVTSASIGVKEPYGGAVFEIDMI